jgi:ApbE superfamily uncharacterized protein (UPF0280 family)
MREPALARLLPDGRRLHLHDGPIDLIIEAFGAEAEIRAAYRAAAVRLVTILDELCSELPLLRAPVTPISPLPLGAIARRMHAAVRPHAEACFITPMAAVAGAVAEAVLARMLEAAELDRAYVNNGGDIALHLAPGEAFSVGMIDRPDRPSLVGTVRIASHDPVRGIATSGRHGRSFSLGIADAVTVLAPTAADADAAATIIANAVDLPGHGAIDRVPAETLDPQSDLGARLVTRGVALLAPRDRNRALESGLAAARNLMSRGLVQGAALHLQGDTRAVGLGTPALAPGRRARKDHDEENRNHA